MNYFELLQEWWNTLSLGTKDNIVGGLFVAGITGILAGLGALLRYFILRFKKDNSTNKTQIKISGNVPKPPRQLTNYVKRFNSEGKDAATYIAQLLAKDQMVVLWGAGGTGKTALAIEAANDMFSDLPHGVIWISIDGIANFDLSRMQDEIIGQLSWLQNSSPFLSESKSALTSLLLRQKRCLIVLDSFEIIDPTHQIAILIFLRDITVPVLITTRKHLSSGEHLHIEPMKDNEARTYVKNLVNNSYKKELIAKIDPNEIILSAEHNPLYIKWIIRQLEVGLDPIKFGLGSKQTQRVALEGDAGERIFGRSFNLLDEDAKRVILLISLFTSSVSMDAIQNISGLDAPLIEKAVWQLTQLDLITLENSRCAVSNSIRRFAPITKEFESEFYVRIVEYYIVVAHRFDYFQNATALDAEYENLVGVLDWLFSHNKWHIALKFFDATGEFLTDRSGYEARLRLGNLVLSAAKKAQDERAYSWHSVYTLGWVYLREGKLELVLPIIEASMDWARRNNNKDVLGLCLRSLGLIEKRKNNLSVAKDLMLESLKAWEEVNDQRWIGMTYTYLAEITLQQNNFDEASTFATQALNIFTSLKNEEGLAWVTDVLGNIMNKIGDSNKARNYFLESMLHREKMRSPAGIAHTQMSLAKLEQSVGNLNSAYRYVQRAHEIYKQLGTAIWVEDTITLQNSITKRIRSNLPRYIWLETKHLAQNMIRRSKINK